MIRIIQFYWQLKRTKHFVIGIGLSFLLTIIMFFSFGSKEILQNFYPFVEICSPIITIQFLFSVLVFIFFTKLNLPVVEILKQRKIIKNAKETHFYQIDQLYGYFGWGIFIQGIFLAYIAFIYFIKSKISLMLLMILFGKFFLSIFFVFGLFYVEILFVHNFYLLYKMVVWRNS